MQEGGVENKGRLLVAVQEGKRSSSQCICLFDTARKGPLYDNIVLTRYELPIPRSPWAEDVDFDPNTISQRDIYIPFAQHVRPEPALSTCTCQFSSFSRLPIELQLYVFQNCDPATIFKLMQTSRALRAEACKLFWSDPSVWYLIFGGWIFAERLPGNTLLAFSVLDYIQQLEIDISYEAPHRRHAWDRGLHTDLPSDNGLFWQKLRDWFPSLKRVVLCWNIPQGKVLPLPSQLQDVVQRCPDSLDLSVSVLQVGAGHVRSLYRSRWERGNSHKKTSKGPWEETDSDWERKTVLPPPKAFKGPVGEFSRWRHLGDQLHYIRHAQRIFTIQAMEAYLMENQITLYGCRIHGCNHEIRLLGDWARHALETGHDRSIRPATNQRAVSFSVDSAKIQKLHAERVEVIVAMQNEWCQWHRSRQEDAEHSFLEQLRHDPLYVLGDSTDESTIWQDYRLLMRPTCRHTCSHGATSCSLRNRG